MLKGGAVHKWVSCACVRLVCAANGVRRQIPTVGTSGARQLPAIHGTGMCASIESRASPLNHPLSFFPGEWITQELPTVTQVFLWRRENAVGFFSFCSSHPLFQPSIELISFLISHACFSSLFLWVFLKIKLGFHLQREKTHISSDCGKRIL